MEQNENIQPKDVLSFSYTKESFESLCNATRKTSLRSVCIFVISFLFLSVVFLANGSTVSGIALAVLAVAFSLYYAFNFVKSKKLNDEALSIIENKLYTYELYETHLFVTVKDEKEELKQFIVPLNKIRTRSIDDFLTFPYQNRLYALPMSLLKEHQLLISAILKKESLPPKNTKLTPLRITANVLLVVTILSIFLGIFIAVNIATILELSIPPLWILFFFLPISISTIILGIICKRKGYRYRAHIIVGIIFTFLLTIYGFLGIQLAQTPIVYELLLIL